jgi:uncharacterized protein YggT (Ycf19 family)
VVNLVIVYFVTLFVFLFNLLLVARVLTSYFASPSNRFYGFLIGLTEPVVGPIRAILPKPAGVDFGPLATFFMLEGIQWLVVNFLYT